MHLLYQCIVFEAIDPYLKDTKTLLLSALRLLLLFPWVLEMCCAEPTAWFPDGDPDLFLLLEWL